MASSLGIWFWWLRGGVSVFGAIRLWIIEAVVALVVFSWGVSFDMRRA